MAKKINTPKRGEVFLVNFDPTIGSEIKRTRPALILQNDTSNEYSPITIVAAITSQFDDILYPTEVLLQATEGGLNNDSVVLLNQIRSIDKQRLIRRFGMLKPNTMKKWIWHYKSVSGLSKYNQQIEKFCNRIRVRPSSDFPETAPAGMSFRRESEMNVFSPPRVSDGKFSIC